MDPERYERPSRSRGGFREGADRGRGNAVRVRGGADRGRGGFRGGADIGRGGAVRGRGGADRRRGGAVRGRGGADRGRGGFSERPARPLTVRNMNTDVILNQEGDSRKNQGIEFTHFLAFTLWHD
jgi:hypothetical protein